MYQYHGIIVDDVGFLEFEFTTPFVNSYKEAKDFAMSLQAAWQVANPSREVYWDLLNREGEE